MSSAATLTHPVATETVECDANFTDEHDNDIPCNYSGDALVDILERNGFTITVQWVCPNCGTDHTEDRDIRDEN